MLRKLFNIFLCLLPWKLRRLILIRVYKFEIHPSAKIGFSYIFPKRLIMKENSYIRHFTYCASMDLLLLESSASIARNCWISGYPTGETAKAFLKEKDRKSELRVGKNSKIISKHKFDCTNLISIGDFVTVAGYETHFLTHSINVHTGNQESSPISIGDYCFVGTRCTFLPGSKLPNFSLLAAGAVISNQFNEEFGLYGGVPAKFIKKLSQEDAYFSRERGMVH